MRTLNSALKRLIDIIGAVAAILLFGIPMLIVAALIKITDPGPVLFKQSRAGLGGVPFLIFKFRSMRVNAPDIRNPDGSAYSGTDDPRVTRIGKFIRKTSLDELPQFFNVLLGQMSLVGPRPDQSNQIELYTPEEREKLTVKPGITGLAQISGRNSISWAKRKELDVQYARSNNVVTDLGIILKTIPYVLLRKGITADP